MGSIGNIIAGNIKSFPVTLSGITAVTNTEAMTGGYDAETDDELRLRYLKKVSTPGTSGNKYHYMNWAMEIVGVGDVRVLPLWNGNGTVKVVIINANKGSADANLINEVEAYIEENRPIGANVTVVSATPLSGAMMLGLGSLTEKYIPTLAKMNIEMGMFGNVQLSKLLIALGVIAIGSELFKMVR